MATRYAADTNVSPEKSQADIQGVLRKYGATRFGVMEDQEKGYVMFQFHGLMIQMDVRMPDKSDKRFATTATGRDRAPGVMQAAYEQEIRQRWRALLLAIKAKLEAVETGISTVEKEFLAFVMMPDGKLLGEHLIPQLQEMATSGKMPKMLGMGGRSIP